MIEVRLSNGDWAEADTAEAALLAARTLWDDVSGVTPGQRCYVSFYVNDQCVATVSSRRDLEEVQLP